jgi:N-acyl-D-amino-acid deacylase
MVTKCRLLVVVLITAIALNSFAPQAGADDAPSAAGTRTEKMLRAVERGLKILQKGSQNYPTHRKCFACHHQTLPLLAVREAGAARIETDQELPQAILEFVTRSFRGKIDEMKQGEGIGGKGLTVGYGLWTLELAGAKPDDLTDAMLQYLLKVQEADGHWGLHAVRPPMEDSLVTCTVLAAYGLTRFATDDRRQEATVAVEKAKAWLDSAKLVSQEDKVARLWGLHLLQGDTAKQKESQSTLVALQREDGGWSQLPEMESDAYATATTLYVLMETGLKPDNPAVLKGIDHLLKTQDEGGSWHVKTRATPVQVFFDNGDPHGKDQFISIAATGWATAAVAKGVRPGKRE